MAIPWLTVIKAVPWTEVIARAPTVVEGAKKLWGSVAKKPGGTLTSAQERYRPPPAATATASPLDARLAELEDKTADLHRQMLAATELIGQLADQNARLVERVEANRLRLARLGYAFTALAVAVIVAFIYLT